MPRRKKARYGREMRARAADLFEAGLGFELAAKKLDVPAPAVRKWLYAYRATGRKGLIGMGESRRTYDMETKLAVARAVVDEGMPRSEAMARFGIAAATSLDRWCRLYREGGPEALEPGRRGRPEGPGGRTRERELEERSDVGRVLFGDELDGFASHLQELGVLRNEVRFGVHFEDRTELLVVGDVDHHDAFGRHAAGSLRGFVAELDAQDFFSLGHVAIGFRKRLLALHHRGVGLETQFLHLGGGNSSHVLLLQN